MQTLRAFSTSTSHFLASQQRWPCFAEGTCRCCWSWLPLRGLLLLLLARTWWAGASTAPGSSPRTLRGRRREETGGTGTPCECRCRWETCCDELQRPGSSPTRWGTLPGRRGPRRLARPSNSAVPVRTRWEQLHGRELVLPGLPTSLGREGELPGRGGVPPIRGEAVALLGRGRGLEGGL
jgi:hypothetical protein